MGPAGSSCPCQCVTEGIWDILRKKWSGHVGKILVVICEEKRSFRGPRLRLEDNTELDLKEIWCVDVGLDPSGLGQSPIAVDINTIMTFRVT